MQLLLPLPQSFVGVFQNLIELKYAAGAFAWYCAHEPLDSLFITAQAFLFAGVSPNEIACCACTFGVETHLIHMTAQFGCFAFDEIIQVSAQPVAPSLGIRSFTGALAACNVIDLIPREGATGWARSEEHTSELQSRGQLVCRLLLA